MFRPTFLALALGLLTTVSGCGGSAAGTDDGPEGTSPVSLETAASKLPEADAGDWPWWRGPNRDGTANDQQPPTTWSDTENVVWKTPVPGRGHSSPTIVGDTIYLATADEAQQVQSVVAFDRETGKQKWKRDISQGGFPKTHPKNTHATCTLACDGERLFVAFHHDAEVTLTALDLNGKPVWEKVVGDYDPRKYEYGYAPSPVLYDGLVIVAGDYEKGGWIAAYDGATGESAWKVDRPEKLSFSSPIIAHVAGRDQLLLSGCELVSSYDPATGDRLWATPGTTMATCGTMVWDGDVVFASGGYPKAETIAVKADGSGKVLWTNGQKCYEQSMIAHDGHVYAVTDQGIAFCWEAATGDEKWRERLSGPISASPILAGGNIYLSNEAGTTYVFEATPKAFRSVARNKLGDEAFATPTFVGDRIYARVASGGRGNRQEMLYCLGK